MSGWWRDLRLGVRMLRRAPGFTLAAVLVLALAIGANGAMFSVVHGVLLEPLPYEESDRIVAVWERDLSSRWDSNPVSPPNYLDWKEQQQSFESLAAYFSAHVTLTDPELPPTRTEVAAVDHGFFEVFRTAPEMGRPFEAEETLPGNDDSIILGYRLWQERFGGSREVVGERTTVDGKQMTVVGVMPAGFEFPAETEAWLPLAIDPADPGSRSSHFLRVVGRLAPGVTLERTRTEMAGIARRLERRYPESNEGWGTLVQRLRRDLVGDVRPALLMLQGAVLLVLLIACANVTNLQLTRAIGRSREMAVRTAAGGGRWQLIRQLLAENMVLAAAGGLLGVLFAVGGIKLVESFAHRKVPRIGEGDLGLQPEVLLFMLGITLVTGLLFGLTPALQAGRQDLTDALKEGTRGSKGQGKRTREMLVVVETGLALFLLVGAGLLLNNFVRMINVDPGVQTEDLAKMTLSLPEHRYPDAGSQARFYHRLLREVEALPAVESVAMTSVQPVSGVPELWSNGYVLEGATIQGAADKKYSNLRWVSPGYFETMGIPLLTGRGIRDSDDRDSRRVVVINEAMAQRDFGDTNPIGERLEIFYRGEHPWEIVGVVGDVRQTSLHLPEEPHMYIPYYREPAPQMTVFVEARTDPESVLSALRRTVSSIDRDLVISDLETMEEHLSTSLAEQRFNILLLGLFALVALVLAVIGIYGVVAYSVNRRKPEIGVRMALGATPKRVVWMVLRHGMVLASLGVGLGLLIALAANRLFARFVYYVESTDPITFVAVALLVGGIALLASFLPARRAVKVEPSRALRSE